MDSKSIGLKISKYMEEKGVAMEELADVLEITTRTLKSKLEGKSKLYVSEVIKIKEVLDLDLDEFEKLFFSLK